MPGWCRARCCRTGRRPGNDGALTSFIDSVPRRTTHVFLPRNARQSITAVRLLSEDGMPNKIIYPTNIRSVTAYANGAVDFGIFNGCFGPNEKIKASDIDFTVELNSYFLHGEFKPTGAVPLRGQMLALENRAKDDRTTVFLAWHESGMPTSYQILGLMDSPRRPCNVEGLRKVFNAWATHMLSLPRLADLDRSHLTGWLPTGSQVRS